MVTSQRPTGRASSMPTGLALGAGVNLLVTGISVFLMAKLLQREVIQWEDTGYGVMLLLLGASFLGALTAAKKIKRQSILICGLSGLIYMGILLSITAMFFGGQFEAVGVSAALVFAGSETAGLLYGRERRGGKRLKKRGGTVKLNKKYS